MLGRRGLFRNYSSFFLFIFKVIDLAVLVITGIWTYFLIFSTLPDTAFPKSLILISCFLFYIATRQVHLYTSMRGKNQSTEFHTLIGVGVIMTASLVIISLLLGEASPAGTFQMVSWIVLWNLLAVGILALHRIIIRTGLKYGRTIGFNQRKVLLIGANSNAANVEQEIQRNPEHGLQVVGYLEDRNESRHEQMMHSPHLGKTDNIINILYEYGVDQVWITYPLKGEARTKLHIDQLRYETTSVRYVIDTSAFKDSKTIITNFANIPLLDIDVSPMAGPISSSAKKLEDMIGAIFALLILSPVFLIIAIGVKLSSPGPIFYRQTRISWNNKPFEILKFRSMPVDIEANTGAKWASKGENRATKFGAFLRKTSLDELPQFINVLKGEMSIVGPRPERPELIKEFKHSIPDYMKKHMVKAGITGWAQVNGYRGDTDLQMRIKYDMDYIKHWSPLFDLQIAIMTVYKGFLHKNAY